MLPTTRTAVHMAASHTTSAVACAKIDAKHAKRAAKAQRTLKTGGNLPPLSGERYRLSSVVCRADAVAAANLLACVFDVTNNTHRESRLPQIARSMAQSRGKVRPDMVDSLMSYFANPAELVGRLLIAFLPEKISFVDAKRIVGEHGVKMTDVEVRALIKSINPGSGHAGGRPRKVRTFTGTLKGHSRTYVSEAPPAPPASSQVSTLGGTFAKGFGTGESDTAALMDAFHLAASRQVQA